MWLHELREHHEARRGPVLGIIMTASFAADLPSEVPGQLRRAFSLFRHG